jgi:hypothetical protein
VTNGGKHIEQWVTKSAGPMPNFYPQQERETYQMEIKEIIGHGWGESTSSLPHDGDRVVLEKPTGRVSVIREFLRSCIKLIKYKTMLNTLYDMIDHSSQGRKTLIAQRVVN